MIICNNDIENIHYEIYKAFIRLMSGIKYEFEVCMLFIALIVMNSELYI